METRLLLVRKVLKKYQDTTGKGRPENLQYAVKVPDWFRVTLPEGRSLPT